MNHDNRICLAFFVKYFFLLQKISPFLQFLYLKYKFQFCYTTARYNPVHFMYRAELQLARASSTVQIQTIFLMINKQFFKKFILIEIKNCECFTVLTLWFVLMFLFRIFALKKILVQFKMFYLRPDL